jgi:hypothetical protein
LNLKVLDGLAVAVGAHEFELGLEKRLAHRAGLQQDGRGQVLARGLISRRAEESAPFQKAAKAAATAKK